MDTKGIGSRIKSLRKSKGMTQADLGAVLVPPVSGSAVGFWEKGKTSPSNVQTLLLAEHFCVAAPWLMTGEGPKEIQAILVSEESHHYNTHACFDKDTLKPVMLEVHRRAPNLPFDQLVDVAFTVAENMKGRPEKMKAYIEAELS